MEEYDVKELIAQSLDSTLSLRTRNSRASTHALVICLRSNIALDCAEGALSVVHAGVHPLNELKSVFDAQTGNASASAYKPPPTLDPRIGMAAVMIVSPLRVTFMTYLKYDTTGDEGLLKSIPFTEAHFMRTWSRVLLAYNWVILQVVFHV